MGYQFEWDAAKGQANLRNHGVSFDEASSVFRDPLAILMADPDHSHGEERYLVLGMSIEQRLLVVSHAERHPANTLDQCAAGDGI